MLSALTGDGGSPSTPTQTAEPAEFQIPEPPSPGQQPPAVPSADPAQRQQAAATEPQKPALARALAKKLERDFTGLSDEDRKVFESMSNEAYTKLFPIYKEYMQLAPHKDKLAKLPDLEKERDEALKARWSDHPESYTLNEDYRKAQGQLELVSQIEEVFEDAMVTLQDPAARSVTIVVMGENGKLQRKEVPITPEVRRQVLMEYNGAKEARSKVQATLNETKTRHADTHQKYVAGIQNLHKTLFGAYDKVLGDRPAAHLKSFPAALRARPEGQLLASALALIDIAGEALDKQQVTTAASAANATAVAGAPPSRETMLPAGTKPKNGYSAEEYENFRRNGWIP